MKELIPRNGKTAETEEWRRYRLAWDEYPKRDIVADMPIHLDLEVTNLCQLKCPGCPSQRLDYEKGVMDKDLAFAAVEEFYAGGDGGYSIKFNWRGEPTLCPFLPELISYARDLGIIDLMLNTNGVLVTPAYAEKLLKAGLTTIAWSIDSSVKNSYEMLRPGAVFEEVMWNLNGFLEVRRDLGLVDQCYVRVQRIGYPYSLKAEPNEVFEKFFTVDGVNAIATNHYKEKALEGDETRPSAPCAQPWQRIVMDFQGNMGPCCEMNRFRSTLGRFPETSIRSAWESEGLAFLRKCHSEGKQNLLEACRKCTVTKA